MGSLMRCFSDVKDKVTTPTAKRSEGRRDTQHIPQELVRSVVREVFKEMEKKAKSPHDSPQMCQASTMSRKTSKAVL